MGFSTSGLLLQGSSGATKGTGLMCPPALFFATAFAAIAAAIVPKCFSFSLFSLFIFYIFLAAALVAVAVAIAPNIYQLINPRFHFSSPTSLVIDPNFIFHGTAILY